MGHGKKECPFNDGKDENKAEGPTEPESGAACLAYAESVLYGRFNMTTFAHLIPTQRFTEHDQKNRSGHGFNIESSSFAAVHSTLAPAKK